MIHTLFWSYIEERPNRNLTTPRYFIFLNIPKLEGQDVDTLGILTNIENYFIDFRGVSTRVGVIHILGILTYKHRELPRAHRREDYLEGYKLVGKTEIQD